MTKLIAVAAAAALFALFGLLRPRTGCGGCDGPVRCGGCPRTGEDDHA